MAPYHNQPPGWSSWHSPGTAERYLEVHIDECGEVRRGGRRKNCCPKMIADVGSAFHNMYQNHFGKVKFEYVFDVEVMVNIGLKIKCKVYHYVFLFPLLNETERWTWGLGSRIM